MNMAQSAIREKWQKDKRLFIASDETDEGNHAVVVPCEVLRNYVHPHFYKRYLNQRYSNLIASPAFGITREMLNRESND